MVDFSDVILEEFCLIMPSVSGEKILKYFSQKLHNLD